MANSRLNIVFNALNFPIVLGSLVIYIWTLCPFPYITFTQMTHMLISEHVLHPRFGLHIHLLACSLVRSLVRLSALASIILCSRIAVIKFVFVFTSFLFHEKCKQRTALLVYLPILVGFFLLSLFNWIWCKRFRECALIQCDVLSNVSIHK